MFPSFEDRARSSMARERVAQRDAELAEARAEVERLRALVGRQREIAVRFCEIHRCRVRALEHCGCNQCSETLACLHEAESVLLNPDGQRAAEEWNALVKVAEAAQAHERGDVATYMDLQRALGHLRAVRGGKEEQGGQ